ncbi:hypothetical protein 88605_46 [Lactococcus phage 88605]|jgi:hypothetical protein|uniref:Uncharacterized protein n=1 Tax=Lactococcus phage 88605 TaxID=2029673 RepID=A0A343JQR4_9CAUD|nr:hypothetical protein HYP39_gp46 [Lactococcus phage 88605]ASZ71837.1 hypothetical protein 88605_46 [Lactococcus phage 88605]
MSEKWYVIKVGDENRKNKPWLGNYLVQVYVDNLEETIIEYGDTTVLVTPSEEVAYRTKRVLDEQLRKQGN